MKFNKVVYCHWDIFRFMKEKVFAESKCSAVSITDSKDIELMIFLGKKEDGEGYNVRVYTTETEFDNFDFDDFGSAHKFIDNLAYEHPEYRKRPTRKIDKTKKDNYANM